MRHTAPYPSFELPSPMESTHLYPDSTTDFYRNHYTHEDTCVTPGFDLVRELLSLDGPTVEVGGPSRTGYMLLNDGARLPQPLLVSNMYLEKPLVYLDELNFMADARSMPLRPASVGVVLDSGVVTVPREYDFDHPEAREIHERALQEYAEYQDGQPSRYNQRIKLAEEAARILRPGGLLIMKTIHPDDFEVARLNGLTLKQTHTVTHTHPQTEHYHPAVTGVLQKPTA